MGHDNLMIDNLQGFTIKQIENALGRTENWSEWKEEIQEECVPARYNNGATSDKNQRINDLFDFWWTWIRCP